MAYELEIGEMADVEFATTPSEMLANAKRNLTVFLPALVGAAAGLAGGPIGIAIGATGGSLLGMYLLNDGEMPTTL